jgi:nitrite reductase/ring-hydroxylating ferredoxin subunit
MASREENELLTRTGPGTPCGELMRRYWLPVALAEELPEGGAPVPLTIMGEELVLFRDDAGRPGLLGLHCAHRGADLSYGRLEDGGLRCIYHGWLYDIAGRCLEQPGEPAGSTFHERIRQTAYPCQERAGAIFAYMGPGGPPLLPNYDFLTAPDDYAVATKLYSECNFLQALDGGLDPAHVAFLHWNRARGSSDPRSAGNGRSVVYAEETDYGVRIAMVRPLEGEQHFIGITDYILPSINAFTGLSRDGYSVNWFVPIDDVTYWKFNFTFSRERTLAKQTVRDGRTPTTADYYPAANRGNRYLQDREAMRTESFSGIPSNMIQAQDACACDGAGRIQDRAQEHLATTDRGIVASRTALLKAIRAVQAGGDPPHVIRDPAANRFDNLIVDSDVVPSSVTWQTFIAEAEARRREASVLA